jgi:hypothetical protein
MHLADRRAPVSSIKKLAYPNAPACGRQGMQNSECGIQNTKNSMEHSAKGITIVFLFLLAKDLSFILEK